MIRTLVTRQIVAEPYKYKQHIKYANCFKCTNIEITTSAQLTSHRKCKRSSWMLFVKGCRLSSIENTVLLLHQQLSLFSEDETLGAQLLLRSGHFIWDETINCGSQTGQGPLHICFPDTWPLGTHYFISQYIIPPPPRIPTVIHSCTGSAHCLSEKPLHRRRSTQ